MDSLKCTNQFIDFLVREEKTKIEEFLNESNKEVVCHGCGLLMPAALEELREDGLQVPYVIDDVQGKDSGMKCLDLDVVSREDERVKSNKYIIATLKPVRRLKNTYKGTNKKIISYSAYHLCKHYDEYVDVRDNYLEDEKSKIVFNMAMFLQLSDYHDGDMSSVCDPNQYFGVPEFDVLSREYFVDCGAFVGDILDHLILHGVDVFRKYYGFEPSEDNRKALECRKNRIINEWGFEPDRIEIIEGGVGAKDSFVDFASGTEGAAFRLEESNGGEIPIYSLDSKLGDKKVTYIKADIEGFEMDMINGAEKILKSQKPKVAVSAYHLNTDLYLLPKRIREINGDYKFKLRSHSKGYEELVYYCY